MKGRFRPWPSPESLGSRGVPGDLSCKGVIVGYRRSKEKPTRRQEEAGGAKEQASGKKHGEASARARRKQKEPGGAQRCHEEPRRGEEKSR